MAFDSVGNIVKSILEHKMQHSLGIVGKRIALASLEVIAIVRIMKKTLLPLILTFQMKIWKENKQQTTNDLQQQQGFVDNNFGNS